MAQPSPAPGAPPSLTDTVTPTGTGSSADKFGLGDWGQAAGDPSGLLPLPPGSTNDDIMKAFLRASQDPNQVGIVAAIQQALYLSGYYGSDKYAPGLVREADQKAFAKALTDLARINEGSATPKPLSTFLTDQAQRAVALGGAASRPTVTANLPSVVDIVATAQKVWEQVLGHKLKPGEAQRFAQEYRADIIAQTRNNANAQLGINSTEASPTATDTLNPAALTPSGGNAPDPNGPAAFRMAEEASSGGDPNAPDGGIPPTPGSPAQFRMAESASNDQFDAAQPSAFAQHILDIANANSQGSQGVDVVPQDSVPDVSNAAEQYARQHYAGEAGANDIANTFNQFLRLLGGKLA